MLDRVDTIVADKKRGSDINAIVESIKAVGVVRDHKSFSKLNSICGLPNGCEAFIEFARPLWVNAELTDLMGALFSDHFLLTYIAWCRKSKNTAQTGQPVIGLKSSNVGRCLTKAHQLLSKVRPISVDF